MPSGSLLKLNALFSFAFRSSLRAAPQPGPSVSLEGLFRNGRISFGNFGFCGCSQVSTRWGLRSVSTLSSSCHFNSQNNRCFVAETLSQTLCGPFISVLTCPVLVYPGSRCHTKFMATSGSRAAAGDLVVDSLISSCGNLSNFVKPAGVYFSDKCVRHCQRANVSLRSQERSGGQGVYGYHGFAVTHKSSNSSPFVGQRSRNFHTSSSPYYSDGAPSDVSLDESSNNEQLVNSAVSSDQSILGDRTLRLLSGSCYLPHPEKEKTGGEDAHFICEEEQAIGVADGVGGWADVGVNAGHYSRELMSYSVSAIQDEPRGSIDPARVLEKAHSATRAKGSSTACIIALTNQGLHAINLGDSGFIVVRDGCTIFRSPVQQHGFNFTYQLESGNRADLPSSGQVFTMAVLPGDVVVAGTDGLFDNLYNNEITAVIVHAVRTGLDPWVTAQKIAALARQRALDRNRQTPFSTAAQEAGYRYYGGKLDDTTVVIAYITTSSNT